MKRQGLSPVLIELLAVVLFFAVCAGINVRVLAEANRLSRESELQSTALLAASNLCEQLRADPTGFGAFDGADSCVYESEADGLALRAVIRRGALGGGTYYTFSVFALDGETELAALHGGSYRKGVRP